MFEQVWIPVIVLPLALLLVNRFTYFFDLEWDKLNRTKFDRIKYRLVDSVLLTLFFLLAIILTTIKTEKIDLQGLFKNNSQDIVTYSTLIAFIIYLLICNYTILSIFFTFVKSKRNIKILSTNDDGNEEEYDFNKGMDGSLHLYKNSYGIDTIVIKKGKVLLEESTIKYKILSPQSKVDVMILTRLNHGKKGFSYKMNSKRKTLINIFFAVIIFFITLCIVNETWINILKLWFIWILWLFLIYLVIELLSVFYIPFIVHRNKQYLFELLYGIKSSID